MESHHNPLIKSSRPGLQVYHTSDPMTSQKCLSEELIENRCYLRQQLLPLDKWEKLANWKKLFKQTIQFLKKSMRSFEKVRKRCTSMRFSHVYSLKVLSENNSH